MAELKKDPNEIGALWSKTNAHGEYFTGSINGQPVVVFKNKHKPEDSNQPDWRVLKPRAKEEPRHIPDEDFLP